ncbi:MAG: hypothetical protein LUQ26_01795 [Methylococcaceae bacterium]|nr:hypothetical protein [Methylococcaceae bacterium]
MKLFVWENVLTDWTSGIMFAVAPTVEEARVILLGKCGHIPEEDINQTPLEFDLSEPIAFLCWGGG